MSLFVLLFSVLFIIYVYVGYPCVLWVLVRNKTFTYPNKDYVGDVSIVMVVCNEGANVVKKIENILSLKYQGGKRKIIIVDDCSDDETCKLIEGFGDKVTLIRNDKRKGKANGINRAMVQVSTELVMLVDCRQEIELNAINYLASWFALDLSYGAVSGELLFRPNEGNEFSEGLGGYWKYEKFIRKSEASVSSVPGVTGALYMLRTSAFHELPVDTLLDDVQIPMVCISNGYRVGFDDRAIAWDIPSTSIEKEKARKIRTLGGNYQLLSRFPAWIFPTGHPIWWSFFSHKIARLFAPILAICSLVAAIALCLSGSFFAGVYSVLMVTMLMMPLLSVCFPSINRIKLLNLMNSFVILNWFCLLAFPDYFINRQSGVWKK